MIAVLLACHPETAAPRAPSETPDTADTAHAVADTADTADDTGGWESGDTGIPPGERCPPDVQTLSASVCAATTAVVQGASTYDPSADRTVTGAVTEVGGALAPVGSAFPGLLPCSGQHDHQIRVVDEAGETWTVGWTIQGALDDASADAVSVGAPVTLHVVSTYGYYGYVTALGFALADDGGPIVFYETDGPFLGDDERAGVGVTIDYADNCRVTTAYGPEDHRLVTFAGPAGTLELRSGESGVLAGDRPLTIGLASANWLEGCADWCGDDTWAGWETP